MFQNHSNSGQLNTHLIFIRLFFFSKHSSSAQKPFSSFFYELKQILHESLKDAEQTLRKSMRVVLHKPNFISSDQAVLFSVGGDEISRAMPHSFRTDDVNFPLSQRSSKWLPLILAIIVRTNEQQA